LKHVEDSNKHIIEEIVRQVGHVPGLLGAFAKQPKATISFVMSVCLYVPPSVRNNSAPAGRIFTAFDIWIF